MNEANKCVPNGAAPVILALRVELHARDLQ